MSINNLSSWLENKVQSFLKETVDTIVGHYQDALQTNEDYRGRQLLELLQNADDAFDGLSNEHKVCIELRDRQLIIKNTGIGFSKEGVESLLTSNLSPKDNNYIGNKGLGFRSILNWAKKIYILSQSKENEGLWSFSFSRDYAIERFELLDNDKKNLARSKAQNKEKYPIATLRCPKWDNIREVDDNYTTTITLNLKEFAIHEIKEQFKKINENILVFLPSLSEIEIIYDQETIIYKKIVSSLTGTIDEVMVEKYHNETTTLKQWTVHNKKGKIEVLVENDYGVNDTEEKDYYLAVAYQDDLSDNANHLFSFFSTEVPFHIPALVHGTFDLEGNRNKISNTDANKELLKKLSDLLIVAAQYISDNNKIASWVPLSLIYFEEEKYDDRLVELKFYDYLLELIKNSTLFPCYDGKYRRINDTLLFDRGNNFSLHNDIHRILKYEKFNILNNFLLYTDDKKNQELVYEWSYDFINDNDVIITKLNSISQALSEEERVEIIHCISNYKELWKNKYLELLVDDNNIVIKNDIDVYTPKTGTTLEFKIPKHINLSFMNKNLYGKLIKKFTYKFRGGTEDDARKLQAILKEFLNLHSYEPDPVIKKIISGTDSTNSEEIKEMLKALQQAFISILKKNKEYKQLDVLIPLLNKKHDIIFSRDIYLGTPYNQGEFIEKIYNTVDINYLASPIDLDLLEKSSLELFFKWLGVNEYSKIKSINILDDDYHPYIQWFKKHTQYDFKRYSPQFDISAISIEYISEVFNNNTLEDILFWFKLSDGIKKITTKSIRFLTGRNISQKTSAIDIDKQNYSYFQWEIEKVIPTKSGNKASSRNCILPDLNLDLSPVLETVSIDYKRLEELGIERAEAKDLLHQIGVYRDFYEIDSNKIEGILNDLYISDNEGKQAKKIYRLILKKYADYKKDDVWKIKLKCQNIQVYCKKGEEKSYFPSSEAYYLDEFIYPKAILKNYPLIEIGIRQGQSKIKHIFGVEPLKDLNISLDSELSKENYLLNIQDDIESVKPYILAFRLKQLEGKDQSKVSHPIKDMKVKLMSTLAVKLDGETIFLDEFDYIYDRNIFYISTKQNSLDELRKNINYIDLIAVLFSTVLKVTSDESKYKEVYKDKYHRKHILDTHTENEADKYLDEAKKQLHIRSYKLEFWNDVAVLMEIDENITDETNINEFFKLNINIDSINYENLSAELNYKVLKKIFNKKITLENFNKISTLNINFISYYERKLLSEFDRVKKIYKAYVWSQLNEAENYEQQELNQRWNSFDKIDFTKIINSFEFSVKDYFSQCLYEKTGVLLEVLNNFEMIEFEKYYFNFKENKDEYLLDALWKNIDEHLSYFENHHDELNKQYYLLEEATKNENIEIEEVHEEEPEYNESESSLPILDKKEPNKFSGRKSPAINGGKRNHSENSITGEKGEKLVYEKLKTKFPRVDWVSEYAKKAGVNAEGKDGYGYDITYWDKEGDNYFIEVKSTKMSNNGNTISFNMSINEYRVAKEKGEYYKIFYVSSVGDSKPKIRSFTFNDNNVKKNIENYMITTSLINKE